MNTYFYSKTENGFFTSIETAPADAVEISTEQWSILLKGQDEGNKIISDAKGYPVLVTPPPPSKDDLIAMAESQRKLFIGQANDYMNSKQWPGKAAMGRLKGDELTYYGNWLDYLDALEAVDITLAPDIAWPDQPE